MEITLRHSLLDRVCFWGAARNERSRWAGSAPPTPVSPVRSPVEFHGDLHAPPGVGLALPVAEVGVLQRGAAAQGAKLHTVQQVEGLPSDVQVLLLLQRNTPREGDAFAEGRELTYLRVVPRRGAQGGSGLRAQPRNRLEEAVCPGIEFSRVTARPAVVRGDRRPVCSVENRETDGRSQGDGRPAGVVLNSGETPAAQNGGRRALAAQELLPLAERQLVHIVDLHHVGLVVRGNRFFQNPVVVVFRAAPLAVRVGD